MCGAPILGDGRQEAAPFQVPLVTLTPQGLPCPWAPSSFLSQQLPCPRPFSICCAGHDVPLNTHLVQLELATVESVLWGDPCSNYPNFILEIGRAWASLSGQFLSELKASEAP